MSTLDDLTEQEVWSKIARAYERVIIQTSFYEKFMDDVAKQVLDAAAQLREEDSARQIHVADMGCGVGYLIDKLLDADPILKITGIDSNRHMLDIARDEIIDPEKDYALIHADAEAYKSDERYDIIVSTNVVFNLPRPFKFITNCHRHLTEDGHLVLSSAMPDPDLLGLVEKAKAEFDAKRWDRDEHVDIVRTLNEGMMESYFRTFTVDEIADKLEEYCGFSPTAKTTTFGDQNFLVSGQRVDPKKYAVQIESGTEAYEEAWRLRHFILTEMVDVADPNMPLETSTPYDAHSELLTVRDEDTGRLLGFQNIIHDSPRGFMIEETHDISEIRNEFGQVASFAGTYIATDMFNKRLGAFLIAYGYELMCSRGIEACVMDVNPELSPFVFRCGAFEFAPRGQTLEGLPKLTMAIDLSENNEKREMYAQQFISRVGEENITYMGL